MSTRPYRSPLRESQARATRQAVVEAARDLFIERGWSATTIESVADRAGVSRRTVFTAVGGKTALLKVALDWALVGDDEPVPMADRPAIAEMAAEQEPAALVARWARFLADIEERAAPLAAVLDVAADVDPEAAAVREQSERNRAGGARSFVERLEAIGGLRAGLTPDRAAATAQLVMDPAVHRTLVGEHGWPREDYVGWVVEVVTAMLLPRE